MCVDSNTNPTAFDVTSSAVNVKIWSSNSVDVSVVGSVAILANGAEGKTDFEAGLCLSASNDFIDSCGITEVCDTSSTNVAGLCPPRVCEKGRVYEDNTKGCDCNADGVLDAGQGHTTDMSICLDSAGDTTAGASGGALTTIITNNQMHNSAVLLTHRQVGNAAASPPTNICLGAKKTMSNLADTDLVDTCVAGEVCNANGTVVGASDQTGICMIKTTVSSPGRGCTANDFCLGSANTTACTAGTGQGQVCKDDGSAEDIVAGDACTGNVNEDGVCKCGTKGSAADEANKEYVGAAYTALASGTDIFCQADEFCLKTGADEYKCVANSAIATHGRVCAAGANYCMSGSATTISVPCHGTAATVCINNVDGNAALALIPTDNCDAGLSPPGGCNLGSTLAQVITDGSEDFQAGTYATTPTARYCFMETATITGAIGCASEHCTAGVAATAACFCGAMECAKDDVCMLKGGTGVCLSPSEVTVFKAAHCPVCETCPTCTECPTANGVTQMGGTVVATMAATMMAA